MSGYNDDSASATASSNGGGLYSKNVLPESLAQKVRRRPRSLTATPIGRYNIREVLSCRVSRGAFPRSQWFTKFMADTDPEQQRQRERTAEQYAEIARLVGCLAHEIKNPLSTINLNMELLARTSPGPTILATNGSWQEFRWCSANAALAVDSRRLLELAKVRRMNFERPT